MREKALHNAAGCTIRSVSAVLLAVLLAGAVFARDRGPRVQVVCSSTPIPVRMDEEQVLVYELHITNFDSVPLTLGPGSDYPEKQVSVPWTNSIPPDNAVIEFAAKN